MKVLIAASPSFTIDDMLAARIQLLKQRRPDAEMHVLTQKHFTKMVTSKGKTVVHVRDFAAWGPAATTKGYEAILEHADGAIIFWDGESKPEQNLIRMCQERPLQHEVIRFESLKQELERLKREGKVEKKTKKAIVIEPELKERYYGIHKAWQESNTPAAFNDHGYTKCKAPVIYNASGLQTWIENIFNWSGHHLQRIASQGVYRKGKGFTYSGTTNGATDDSGHFCSKNHIYPLPVYIETKFNKDTMSKAQLKFKGKMERTGALHFIQSVPEDAFLILDYLGTL